MRLISMRERHILEKFKKGSDVSDVNEEMVLNRYAGIGFVQFGYDWDNMKETAKLTDSGIKHLNR
ncbi:MAG: hypothetical protein MIO93_02595 [ANME-2 cluster archaeon]|jgi:hypothetical protein|nr:hypothetical protein [ANME-2 cluster archaeon]